MIKKIILSVALMVAAIGTKAESLQVKDVVIPQNGTASIEIELDNPNLVFEGFTFAMQLLDGLVPVMDGDGFPLFEKGERIASKLPSSGYEGNTAKFALLTNGTAISGTSGLLIAPNVKLSADAAVGTKFTVTLTDIVFTTPVPSKEELDDVTFTVTVGEPDDGYIKFNEASATLPDYTAGEKGNVRMFRTIVANQWNTIVLPFTLNKAKAEAAFGSDVQLAEFSGFEVEYADEEDVTPDAITINFSTYTMTAKKGMTGGKPFLIKTSKDIAQFEAEECTLVGAVTNVSKSDEYETPGVFTGSLVKTKVPTDGLFIYDNKFYYSTGSTNIKAFRAWLELGAVLDKETDFEANVRYVIDGEVTSIEGLPSAADQSGAVYTLKGQLVGYDVDMKTLPAGIYLVNGKKVIVK